MLALVLLNFRTYNDTFDLVSSLSDLDGVESVKIFLVDNESNKEKLKELKLKLTRFDIEVTYLPIEVNVGFARGMNRGISAARSEGYEVVLVSNNDILFREDFSFTLLYERIRSELNVGMLGPRIVDLGGEDQNPLYLADPFENKYKICVLRVLCSIPLVGRVVFVLRGLILYRKRKRMLCVPDCGGSVYALHGAFFVLTPSFFSKFDGLDPGTFLYYEELILACMLESVGLVRKYDPQFRVIHKDDSSTSDMFGGRSFRKKLFVLNRNFESLYFYLKKYRF